MELGRKSIAALTLCCLFVLFSSNASAEQKTFQFKREVAKKQSTPDFEGCGGVPGVENDEIVQDLFNTAFTDNRALGFSFLAKDDRYYICLDGDVKTDKPVVINTKASGGREIVVKGLSLIRSSNYSGPLLRIVNNGDVNVFIKNLKLENGGLEILSGGKSGNVSVIDSVIRGGSSRRGSGVSIMANKTVLDNVAISGWADGLKIQADDVLIKNKTKVFDNNLGVYVFPGFKRFEFKGSVAYGNDFGNRGQRRLLGADLNPEVGPVDEEASVVERKDVPPPPTQGDIVPGDVTYVTTPYDVPTSGVEEEAAEPETGDDSEPQANAFDGDAASIDMSVGAGKSGCGASIVDYDDFNLGAVCSLWWFFILILIAIRLAAIRLRRITQHVKNP